MNTRMDIPPAHMEQIVLQRVQMCIAERVCRLALQDAQIDVVEQTVNQLVYRLRFWMAAKDDVEEIDVSRDEARGPVRSEAVPLTWWDHAKATFAARFPKIGDRLRVNSREVVTLMSTTTVHRHIITRRMCPHVDVPYKRDSTTHLRFMQGLDPAIEKRGSR